MPANRTCPPAWFWNVPGALIHRTAHLGECVCTRVCGTHLRRWATAERARGFDTHTQHGGWEVSPRYTGPEEREDAVRARACFTYTSCLMPPLITKAVELTRISWLRYPFPSLPTDSMCNARLHAPHITYISPTSSIPLS